MIKNVIIKPGCIGCHMCEDICPKVFHVNGTSRVITRDFSDEKKIFEAEKNCPVNVIAVEQDTVQKISAAFLPALFLKKRALTENVFEFLFSFSDLSFTPGQFVALQMKDKQGVFARCYSITDYENGVLTLCIKLISDGRGSTVLAHLKPKTSVLISSAKGKFLLQTTQNKKIFIATGTGIAPMITMIKHAPTIAKILVLGFGNESDILYTEELKNFPKLKTEIVLSQPSEKWKGKKGYVTDVLKTMNITPDTEIYICGNPKMIESVIQYFKDKNHPQNLVFFEHFSPPSPPAVASAVPVSATVSPGVGSASGWRLSFSSFLPWGQRFFLLCSLLIPFSYFFPDSKQWLWNLTLYTVTAVMLIRPLADIFPKIKFLRLLVPLRKELGIFSASIVVTFGAFHYLNPDFDFLSTYFSSAYWSFSGYIFWGHLAELVGFFLLITSNIFSQRMLKKFWKRIQRLSYVYFFAGSIYVLGAFGNTFALYAMIAVTALWILSFFKIKLWK